MSCAILTQARLKEVLNYDPEVGIFTWKVRPCTNVHIGDIAGANTQGYRQIRIDKRLYRSPRLAWLYVHGVWPTGQIDHRDRDRANNKIDNLRDVTQAVNQHNSGVRVDSKSGLTGVTWSKKAGMWRSRINANNTPFFLGYFNTPELASAAYQAAKLIYHPTAPK